MISGNNYFEVIFTFKHIELYNFSLESIWKHL